MGDSSLESQVELTETSGIFLHFKIHMNEMMSIEKVAGCDSIFYIRNAVTKEKASFIQSRIDHVPAGRWKNLANRRLQIWGGTPSEKGMIQEAIPTWLSDLIDELAKLMESELGERVPDKFIKPNHVLINDYQSHQGIMAHKDGPLYNPVILTLSLGSPTLEYFTHDTDVSDVKTVLLEPNSLIVIYNDMYTEYLHSIDEETIQNLAGKPVLNVDSDSEYYGASIERQRRISLTFRFVPKTRKNPLLRLKR